jgi:hypothetical protein
MASIHKWLFLIHPHNQLITIRGLLPGSYVTDAYCTYCDGLLTPSGTALTAFIYFSLRIITFFFVSSTVEGRLIPPTDSSLKGNFVTVKA